MRAGASHPGAPTIGATSVRPRSCCRSTPWYDGRAARRRAPPRLHGDRHRRRPVNHRRASRFVGRKMLSAYEEERRANMKRNHEQLVAPSVSPTETSWRRGAGAPAEAAAAQADPARAEPQVREARGVARARRLHRRRVCERSGDARRRRRRRRRPRSPRGASASSTRRRRRTTRTRRPSRRTRSTTTSVRSTRSSATRRMQSRASSTRRLPREPEPRADVDGAPLPTTPAELVECWGWGETKVSRHGERLLAVLEPHVAELRAERERRRAAKDAEVIEVSDDDDDDDAEEEPLALRRERAAAAAESRRAAAAARRRRRRRRWRPRRGAPR